MKWNRICYLLLGLTICFVVMPAEAAPELFTAEYYVANAQQWLNKDVTLSVSYFVPADGKVSIEGMEVMTAHTFHNHVDGGHINVVATPAIFTRLRATCGLHVLKQGGWVHTNQIHGILRQKDGEYYVQVEK